MLKAWAGLFFTLNHLKFCLRMTSRAQAFVATNDRNGAHVIKVAHSAQLFLSLVLNLEWIYFVWRRKTPFQIHCKQLFCFP